MVSLLFFLSFSVAPILAIFTGAGSSGEAVSEAALSQWRQEAEGYAEVLTREPDNLVALRGLVDARLQLQEYREAIAPLEKLVALAPDLSLSVLLGRLKLVSGDAQGALTQFQELYRLHPDDPLIVQALILAQMEAGEHEAAITLLDQQLQGKPEDPDLLLQLADAYGRSGDPTRAIQVYERLMASRPTDFRPVFGKALILSQDVGNSDQQVTAQALFQRAEQLAPREEQDRIRQSAQFYAQLASPTVTPGATPTSPGSPETP